MAASLRGQAFLAGKRARKPTTPPPAEASGQLSPARLVTEVSGIVSKVPAEKKTYGLAVKNVIRQQPGGVSLSGYVWEFVRST